MALSEFTLLQQKPGPFAAGEATKIAVVQAESVMKERCIEAYNEWEISSDSYGLHELGLEEIIRYLPPNSNWMAEHDERVRLKARLEEAKWWSAPEGNLSHEKTWRGNECKCEGCKRIADLQSQLDELGKAEQPPQPKPKETP